MAQPISNIALRKSMIVVVYRISGSSMLQEEIKVLAV